MLLLASRLEAAELGLEVGLVEGSSRVERVARRALFAW